MSAFSDNSYNRYGENDFLSVRDSSQRSDSESAIEHAIRTEEQGRGKEFHHFRFGSGASLVLISLIIISVLCFAALSIVSARADQRLTDRYEEQVNHYLDAHGKGQDYIAQTDAAMEELYHNIVSREDYFTSLVGLEGAVDPSDTNYAFYDELQDVLRNTDVNPDSCVFVFTCAMSDTQEYFLVLQPLWPGDSDGAFYRILSSKVLSTASYDYDSKLNVLQQE